jgi:hypothetical protein
MKKNQDSVNYQSSQQLCCGKINSNVETIIDACSLS